MALVTGLTTSRANTDANLFSDVYDNDALITAQVNGNLDSDNILDNSVELGKLENQTAGQLLIANSSGIITGTAMSGDATISDAGVVTLSTDSVGTSQIEDDAVDSDKASLSTWEVESAGGNFGGSYAQLATLTQSVPASTCLVVVELNLSLPQGNSVDVKIRVGGVDEVERTFDAPATLGVQYGVCLTAIAAPVATAAIDVFGQRISGSGTASYEGRMCIVRVA